MGQLTLVRHAQASFFGADYDQLSALGFEQARRLGAHFASHRVAFDRVFIGPRRRHRETCECVAEAYRSAGLDFPAATELAELDEHHGTAVVKQELGIPDAAGPAMHPTEEDAAARERAVRAFFKSYNSVMRDWARGTVVAEGIESWEAFRARSRRALDLVCAGSGRHVAFTSGGLVSSATGWLLGLDDEKVIDLSIVLRNTALTEVAWSSERRSLLSFNSLPHLPDPSAATAV
jgi:broad specificity phosphatase PhoE